MIRRACFVRMESAGFEIMTDWGSDASKTYTGLTEYSALRTRKISEMLQPYIEVTDRYGTLICRITLVLGKIRPRSMQERVLRDLMADVFDFLYETRALIIKGKTEVAYPLARRAYESLSLMVACHMEPKLAERWAAGNRVRR